MLFDFIAALEFFLFFFFSSSRILCFCPRVAPCGHILSCSTEEMCRLPVASLIICFWLVERSYCNNSLQDSMRELHTRFAISLYQTLTETENNSNLIVSPVSVSLSLALLQLGARGNTLAQLEGTLGYNVNGRFLIFPLLKFLNIGMEMYVFIQVALETPYAVWKRLKEGGPQCCWYQVVWSSAPAAVRPAEHSGVWSHNTCLYTNSNLINDFFSSAFGSRG